MNIDKDIKKENHFSAPKNYFDYLPEEIMNRIQIESKEKFFLLKPSFIISSLAVLSGIIIFIVFFLKKDVATDEIILSDNEVEQIIDNPELYNIDDAAITEEYLSSNISDELLNTDAMVSDEDIKSYLEDNTDVNNNINEL